jgi:hypothetical protein
MFIVQATGPWRYLPDTDALAYFPGLSKKKFYGLDTKRLWLKEVKQRNQTGGVNSGKK